MWISCQHHTFDERKKIKSYKVIFKVTSYKKRNTHKILNIRIYISRVTHEFYSGRMSSQRAISLEPWRAWTIVMRAPLVIPSTGSPLRTIPNIDKLKKKTLTIAFSEEMLCITLTHSTCTIALVLRFTLADRSDHLPSIFNSGY